MGGLFKAPKPKIIVQPVAPASSIPDAAASEARIENRARATNGMTGTIATSARGLLDTMPDFVTTRRSLLGE